MRRNNTVFLVGSVVEYAEREAQFEGKSLPLIDLVLQTDKPEISAPHKVVVRGRQVLELKCFLQAAQPEVPDVAVLGWLRSSGNECLVMAERVTVLTNREVRRKAVEAIQRAQASEPSAGETLKF